MTEFLLKIADVIVQVKTKTDRPWKRCRKYLVEEGVPEITVEITDEDLERDEEFLAVQRKITEKLIDFDVLLFHSSLMAVDGFGYAYSAASGTGKSTHTAILRKVYGDRVQIVNDDKPFLRLKDGVVYAYGTPWAGKEHLENNIKVPLHAMCFIHRAEENEIKKIDAFTAYIDMFKQVYRNNEKAFTERVMALMEEILKHVSCYEAGVNMEDDAARVTFSAMSKMKFEDILMRDGVLCYRTKGVSMQPMLTENRDLIVVEKLGDRELKKYDVVLFMRQEAGGVRYVLHRIIRVRKTGYDIVGDNQMKAEKNIQREQILGVLTSFTRDGKEISVTDKKYLRYVHFWCGIYPIRSFAKLMRYYAGRIVRRLK